MRLIKMAFWALVALVLVTVAIANSQIVKVQAMPEALAELTGLSATINLPLYMVVLAGVAFGLVVGLIWEWLREHKHRVDMRQSKREANHLSREVERLKQKKHKNGEDILALVEETT